MCHNISLWRNKIKSTRSKSTNISESDHEKNIGYLVIEKCDSELVLLINHDIDQQQIQYTQTCEQIDQVDFDFHLTPHNLVASGMCNLLAMESLAGSSIMRVDNGLLNFLIHHSNNNL